MNARASASVSSFVSSFKTIDRVSLVDQFAFGAMMKLQRSAIIEAGLLFPYKPTLSNCSKAASYSITASARTSTLAGTSRSSALAVLRLSTVSNLVGACTGKSAGFSPFRMRST